MQRRPFDPLWRYNFTRGVDDCLWLILTVACVVFLSVMGCVRGAPAPLPRRAKPVSHLAPPARCSMTWGGSLYEAVEFRRDGSYRCGGWVGFWRLARDGGATVLVIEERYGQGDPLVWHVTGLSVSGEGWLCGELTRDRGTAVRLKPVVREGE